MAEAMAAVGLAAAILQFIEFGGKVVDRFGDLRDEVASGPRVIQDIRTRLPLMLDLVENIRTQIDAGQIDKTSQLAMMVVLQNCVSQVKQLHEILVKAIPKPNESTWRKGRRALSSVLRDHELEEIDLILRANCEILVQSRTSQALHRLESDKSTSYTSPQPQPQPQPLQQQSVDINFQLQMAPPPKYDSVKRLDHASANSVFMVPFQRDPQYLTRGTIIHEIEKRFETQRQVALAGLGGVGKSQIAIEYSYVFKDNNPDAHVFWIYAGTTARFEQGYQEIARKLSIWGWDDPKVDTLKLVYEWLSDENNGEYLLIVDNADDTVAFFGNRSVDHVGGRDSSKAVARYLPQNPKGSVLVTTRDKRVGERLAGRQKPIVVLAMSASESMNLLRSRITDDEWSEKDAMRLVDELEYLPLAITQAAAFISENDLSVSEYLELLDNGDEDIKDLLSEHLEDPRRELDSENSVMRTWKLSFDQLSKNKPRAAQILSLMAVLDHHGTPRILLRKDGETEVAFRTALGALQAFSLIRGGKEKDSSFKMHRLVALSTQKWLELTGVLRHWQTEALKALSASYPRQQTYQNWATLEALTPHAQLVLSFTFETAMDLLQCAKLMDFAALYDLGKGKYTEAYEKCVKSLSIRESLLEPDHRLTLESAQTLGETLLHRGELTKARALLEKTIIARKRVLGEEHLDTLESISDLTITLLELDDVEAAEETSLTALEGRKKILGDDHPDTLVSLNILSMVMQRKGDLVAAREMCEKALEGREKIIGRNHPDTLMTLNNLAVLQYRQGELNKAKETLEFVLAGEERLLGEEGYDRQVTLSNMALVCGEQGELDKSEEIHRKVLQIREKLFGPDHPATLSTVKNIAFILRQKGDIDAAEKMSHRANNNNAYNGSDGAGALLIAGLLFD